MELDIGVQNLIYVVGVENFQPLQYSNSLS